MGNETTIDPKTVAPAAPAVPHDPKAAALAILDGKPLDPKPADPANPAKPEDGKPVEGDDKDKKTPESKRFAALAKREAAIQKRNDDLKAKETNLTEREAKIQNWDERESARKKEVATNPLKALEYYGLTYQQLTDFILAGEKPTPGMEVENLKKDFDSLKTQQEEERKQARESKDREAKEAHEKTLSDFRDSVREHVTGNAEKYELINLYEQAETVIAVIEEHYKSTFDEKTKVGKILSKDEACERVEKWLELQIEKAATAKKYAKASPEPKPEKPLDPPAPSRTLSNNLTTSTPISTPASSDEDRMSRALAKLG